MYTDKGRVVALYRTESATITTAGTPPRLTRKTADQRLSVFTAEEKSNTDLHTSSLPFPPLPSFLLGAF